MTSEPLDYFKDESKESRIRRFGRAYLDSLGMVIVLVLIMAFFVVFTAATFAPAVVWGFLAHGYYPWEIQFEQMSVPFWIFQFAWGFGVLTVMDASFRYMGLYDDD